MSQSKLRLAITLFVFTGTAVLLASCNLGTGTGGNQPSGNHGAFFLEYNNTFDQPGDDVGGAKTPVDVPVVWAGSRDVGSGEQGQGAGDAFNMNSTWHGFATDPWHTTTIVPNLNPGNWKLSVTVNGQPMSCGSAIALAAGSQVNVTFQVDKESGVFTGCTHN
jgi:hypothetical protein